MNIEKGKLTDAAILSPQTFTYIDKAETEKQKQLALSQVQATYEKDPKVEQQQVGTLREFFSSVLDQKNAMNAAIADAKAHLSSNQIDPSKFVGAVYNPYNFSNQEILAYLNANQDDLIRMREVFAKELENVYSDGITTEELKEDKSKFLNNAIFYHYDEEIRKPLLEKVSSQLAANLKLNKDETEKKQQDALKSVAPVSITIQRGE
jgi:membrane-associated HD superfamily phosphohydrolase